MSPSNHPTIIDLHDRAIYLSERLRLDKQEYHRVFNSGVYDPTVIQEALDEYYNSKNKLHVAAEALWDALVKSRGRGGQNGEVRSRL